MDCQRILLVDDSPDFLRAARQFFSHLPNVEIVGTAVSGLDSLAQVSLLQPDLVIMDLSMPVMNGLEATRRLKMQSDAPAVVIATTHQSQEFQAAAKAAGADGFVCKSRFNEDVPSLLRQLARTREAAPSSKLRRAVPNASSLEDELQCRLYQQAVVAGLGQRALEGADSGILIEEAVALIAATLQADFCTILEFLPAENNLLIRAGVGWREEIVGTRLSASPTESQAGFTLLSNDPILLENLETETRFAGPPVFHRHGVVSGISTIIQGRGGPFGVVSAHTNRLRHFTTHDVHFLQSVANVLATTIQRRAKEMHFQSLIENALDAIAVVDHDGTIQYESPAVERMLGFTPAELVGTSAFRLIHPDDVGPTRAAFANALQNPGVPHRVECRHLHQDGSWRFMESVGQCIFEAGAISVIVNSRDVTDRKLLEQNLLHTQKMETFGQLAGGVAHDFNNVLTIINGYGEIVLDMLDVEHAAREPVAEMQKACMRASVLTRQLLAFSRKQVLAPIILNLNDVVSEMEKMLLRLIGEDIELVSDLQSELPTIKADLGQLEQVIMNLVVNARDAMPEGGQLFITTSQVTLNDTLPQCIPEISPGSYVVLDVRDTGCGMDSTTMARIFEPFFTTKEIGKGTGLGLATVFGIVVQSDGHILVKSKVGTGTTFQIFLPRVEAPLQQPSRDVETLASPSGDEVVLVAEDDSNVRGVVTMFLRTNGYHVLEADDGQDALRVAAEYDGPIHLLVTDVVMPQLGGGDLARQLALQRPGIKVLFLSGYNDDAAVRQGLLAGDVLLQKPFSPATLALRVREALDRPQSVETGAARD